MINDNQQIKMMIMFVLRSAGGTIPSETVFQIMGHVSLITDEDTEYAVLENTGIEIVSALGRDLSPTLRENLTLITAKEVSKLRNDLGIKPS